MATKVYVPRLGEGVDEVTVTKWLKQVGDSINELEPLLEVNTDKVDTEIPAPATGTLLQIVAQEGVPAKVGELLAVIGKPGEKVDSEQLPVNSEQVSVSSGHSQSLITNHQLPTTNRDLGFISPVVAKIAAEHGVDLSQVNGTGLSGRITKNDVLNYVTSGQKSQVKSQPMVNRPQGSSIVAGEGDQLIKHTSMRKSIA